MILVTDDSKTIREFITQLLHKDGFDTIEAETGEDAIELAKSKLPNLILLDIVLPGISGITVCEQLKQIPETKDIPIIFLTGVGDKENISKAFEIGAIDYITKPFNEAELLMRVRNHIKLQQAVKKHIEAKHEAQKVKKQFELIFELSPQAIILTELRSGKITNINRAFSKLTKLRKNKLIGNNTVNLKILTNAERKKLIKLLITSGEIKDYKLTISDNTVTNILLYSRSITIENKQYVLSIATDNTIQHNAEHIIKEQIEELRSVEEELRQNNEELLAVQDNMIDINNELRNSNERQSALNRKLANSKAISEESKLKISKQNNQLKLLNKKLENAKFAAENANRLKSEFLANMSHEIRTPMNAVLGFAEILDNELSDNLEYKSFIDGIIKGGRDLISLINDILDLSKIEAGQMKIKKEPTDLSSLIYDIKQIFSVKTSSKNLEFVLEIDENLPKLLMLDHTRIRQILFNLVGNAVKFTDAGSICVSVTFKHKPEANNYIDLYLKVKDTGIGIPENQTIRIFETFAQTKGQSAKYGGTGLGLPITKRLIEAMNGEITVKSQVNKGSIFTTQLNNVYLVDTNNIKQTTEQDLNTYDIDFNNSKILLVDDMESNRDIVKHHLESHNCTVYEAVNGQEAINFLKDTRIDLILTDIQMPVLNGYEATKLIKKEPKLKSIPVIALTALAMKEQVEKYGEIFDDYLKKPI